MVIGLLAETSVHNICCLLYRCRGDREEKGGEERRGARLESNIGMHAKDCAGMTTLVGVAGRTQLQVPVGHKA